LVVEDQELLSEVRASRMLRAATVVKDAELPMTAVDVVL
jgi:hypothetical protein